MHKNYSNYPKPEKITSQLSKHGDIRMDDYFWLRERENPKVSSYLKEENAYTDSVLQSVRPLENKLFEELKSRVKEDESFMPAKDGDYYYSARYEKGQQYPVYYRTKGGPNGAEEILLNLPEMAKGQNYFSCGGPDMSPNHKILAYAVDTVGRRFYTIYFKDLTTGEVLDKKIENVTGGLEWSNDNETVYYSKQNPETLRSESVYRYNLRTQKSELVYHEKDDTFSVWLNKSLSEKYIYITAYSTLTTEVLFASADNPTAQFKVFTKRDREHQYNVSDGGDRFYIVSNRNAPNYKLMEARLEATDEKSWKELIPHSSEIYLDDITVFKDFIALEERRNGLTQIRITDRDAKKFQDLKFDDSSYMVSVGDNREFDTEYLRFNYESMRLPASVYDLNIKTQEQVLKKTKEVPNYNADLYQTERVFITVRDGSKVPVSMIMKKDFKKDGTGSMLVYGYGSYGANMDPWFSSNLFSLLDRGFVFVRTHIRGGSEMGRHWYDQGRTHKKMNTFYDFIDVTEALNKQGYATAAHTFAMGGSAGGLLMGAVMNMRPDLYKGIVAQVPFVDVISTMLDESIPLTTSEYDQWGNPNVKEDYEYIRRYSPYDNVKDQAYPNVLVTTGFHDSQVQYWEPAKWVPKLREHNKGTSVILLKTDMDSGHGGASGRFDRLKEIATEYAFILKMNGGAE